jgi:hypothetical protein
MPEHGAPYMHMTCVFVTGLLLRLGCENDLTLCIAILLAETIKSTSDGATPSERSDA